MARYPAHAFSLALEKAADPLHLLSFPKIQSDGICVVRQNRAHRFRLDRRSFLTIPCGPLAANMNAQVVERIILTRSAIQRRLGKAMKTVSMYS